MLKSNDGKTTIDLESGKMDIKSPDFVGFKSPNKTVTKGVIGERFVIRDLM